MSEKSNIAWTDSTHNFWRGCTKVSAGCVNCYAEAQEKRFAGAAGWGKGAPRFKSKDFHAPLRWNKKPFACSCGAFLPIEKFAHYGHPHHEVHRRRVFSLSLGDWLDPEVPVEWLADMLDVVRRCDKLDWILCSKRLSQFFPILQTVWRANAYSKLGTWVCDWVENGKPPSNVIILASVENQETADERIPQLLRIPAARRGLSIEPLLGPVDLNETAGSHDGMGLCWDWKGEPVHIPHCDYRAVGKVPPKGPAINWVIVGGESGPKARPCNVEWIRSIKDQCKAAAVPCFVKQFGSNPCCSEFYCNGFTGPHRCGLENMKHPKGGDPAEWPEDLRVQEFYR